MMKAIPTYVTENNTKVEFHSIDNMPGFSHRVVINGAGFSYLGAEFKPSAKRAEYFFQQYMQKVDSI